jgi:hypothetical protein
VIGDKDKQKHLAFRFDYAVDARRIHEGTVYGTADEAIVTTSSPGQRELGNGNAEPTSEELDFALIRLREPLTGTSGPGGVPRAPVKLRRASQLASGGIVFVLQHPNGAPVKLAVGAEKGKNPGATRLYHDANTQPGSSGSMCLNAKLEVIGLHNAGDANYDGIIHAPNNQAVPIGLIFEMLKSELDS